MTSRPFVIGLTGSIGMGKSTTAAFFADQGVPVWDADAAVHRLYAPDGEGTTALQELAPKAVGSGVDRARLKDLIAADPDLLRRIESVIHPLVARDRVAFLAKTSAEIVVCDIPLLFETGGQAAFDAIVVVTAPADVQRTRVLDRPGMTDDALQDILARQMPDAEKRARADYVIDTSHGLEAARRAVQDVLTDIKGKLHA